MLWMIYLHKLYGMSEGVAEGAPPRTWNIISYHFGVLALIPGAKICMSLLWDFFQSHRRLICLPWVEAEINTPSPRSLLPMTKGSWYKSAPASSPPEWHNSEAYPKKPLILGFLTKSLLLRWLKLWKKMIHDTIKKINRKRG